MTLQWRTATDGILLRNAGRDPAAFDVFYRRYEAVVAGWVLRAVRDPEVAADLTAETFARALLKRSSFHDAEGAPAAGWLLAIAGNLVRQFYRQNATADKALRRLAAERPAWSPDSLERVIQLADRDHLLSVLTTALAELPASQRTAVVEYVLNDAGYAELAERERTTETNVRQRVSRGLSRLRTAVRTEEG